MIFEQLMREHDLIDAATLRLETVCESRTPLADRALATRGDLKEVLEDHLGHEDEAIYPRLMLQGGQSAEAVTKFIADFAELRTDWGVYLEDWNRECLQADWDHFCRDTVDLMARVRDRTRQETQLLYPLALRTGAIGLRPVPKNARRSQDMPIS